MPERDEIERLRPWRETCRPPQCGRHQPCWVDDPYEASDVMRKGMKCVSCEGPLTFSQDLFVAWLTEQETQCAT